MGDALLQVVWRSPGGDKDASFVVAGREIDLKMPNLDEFGQFKAQTSAKVLVRPSILNLFTSVLFSTCPIDQVLCENRSEGMLAHKPFFRSEERSWGVNLGILRPGGPGGGLAHARKKNNQGKIGGSEQTTSR